MQYGFDVAAQFTGFDDVEKIFFVNVFCDFAIDQIFEFGGIGEIVHGHNVRDTACIEGFDDIAADKSGCSGNDDGHIFSEDII